MKQHLIVLLLALALLVMAGCGGTGTGSPLDGSAPIFSFTGTVVEVRDAYLLVEPLEGESVRSSADLFEVPLAGESFVTATEWTVGMTVEITFDGTILESYPAQLGRVYSVSAVETESSEKTEG